MDLVTEKIALMVSFHMEASVKTHFLECLSGLFAQIETEESFVEASLQEDLRDSQSVVVVEVWQENEESFLRKQMQRAYRKPFEQALVELNVERTANWYRPLASWKKAGPAAEAQSLDSTNDGIERGPDNDL